MSHRRPSLIWSRKRSSRLGAWRITSSLLATWDPARTCTRDCSWHCPTSAAYSRLSQTMSAGPRSVQLLLVSDGRAYQYLILSRPLSGGLVAAQFPSQSAHSCTSMRPPRKLQVGHALRLEAHWFHAHVVHAAGPGNDSASARTKAGSPSTFSSWSQSESASPPRLKLTHLLVENKMRGAFGLE